MKLSEHFDSIEFEHGIPIPEGAIPMFVRLCIEVLEPVRAHFGYQVKITSGYRSPESNVEAGGVVHSQHIATASYCAVDWYMVELRTNMREVFDWVRLHPQLIWDQMILEHGTGMDVIHTSWATNPRRRADEGHTHGQSSYLHWEVAPLMVAVDLDLAG